MPYNTIEEEIWKDIPDYEGIYQASTLGRIRSLDIKKDYIPINRKPYTKILKGKILKPRFDTHGILVVSLYKNGEKSTRQVHRLVAITFLKKPLFYNVVTFKDGDVTNTKLENLEWVFRNNMIRKGGV